MLRKSATTLLRRGTFLFPPCTPQGDYDGCNATVGDSAASISYEISLTLRRGA